MANEKETKTNRTQLTDLPVTEQELTEKEMEQVQGGKTYNETRSNDTIAAAPPGGIIPPPPGDAGKVIFVPVPTGQAQRPL